MKILALALALILATPAFAQSAADVSSGGKKVRLELHYAPEENLEAIDVRLIAGAVEKIDLAAYVLTDVAVIEALAAAAGRGVKVRLFVEPGQERDYGATVADAREGLFAKSNVEKRTSKRGPFMHLKSYAIDGKVLRTGAANFSASGLKQQDNDLLVSDDAALVKRFETHFEAMWRR